MASHEIATGIQPPGRRAPARLVPGERPRSSVVINVSQVTKVFGSTVALWRIDLALGSKDLIVVEGSNGSGKSTLLRVLAGLAAPTAGRISMIAPSAVRPRIAFLGHATHLFAGLTVLENIVLAARLARRDTSSAIDLLQGLEVGDHAGRRVGDLSTGTRRRVGIARLLATDPDIALFDEPFAGLDQDAVACVASLLTRLRDDGRVVVIASHDTEVSRSIATKVVRLDAGRIVDTIPTGTGLTA